MKLDGLLSTATRIVGNSGLKDEVAKELGISQVKKEIEKEIEKKIGVKIVKQSTKKKK